LKEKYDEHPVLQEPETLFEDLDRFVATHGRFPVESKKNEEAETLARKCRRAQASPAWTEADTSKLDALKAKVLPQTPAQPVFLPEARQE
jgi:hypothetical protein